MAFYKEPCIHCGYFLPRDAQFCSGCGSRSPFIYSCPTCLREIKKEENFCLGCGRPLYIMCPKCLEKTFIQERCEHCGESFLVQCPNKRCQAYQFFQNTKCTACGKVLRK
ncbi:MAG: hypothetical protein GX940_09845 [Clostridiaceae bacterium]|jgi:rRNA maturation protein Nop10|nr:hypothetical protein [Clostridiaceae bacterium]